MSSTPVTPAGNQGAKPTTAELIQARASRTQIASKPRRRYPDRPDKQGNRPETQEEAVEGALGIRLCDESGRRFTSARNSSPRRSCSPYSEARSAFSPRLFYASSKHELVVIPALAWGGGIGAAIFIGAVSGLWPALRAARMSTTQALWSL